MIPIPKNEPILNYLPGSPERVAVTKAIHEARAVNKELPMYIGNTKVFTEKRCPVSPPHDHGHVLGHLHEGESKHVSAAIESALAAKENWENLPWVERAAIFLKAADLISGPFRAQLNAATMLGQSKNVYQAEIDAACEMADFLRFNVKFAEQIFAIQPESGAGMWNRMEYRALEGFVFALSPFNFTAIAGNLPAAPAMMGNTVVWKPAYTQAYSADLLMQIFLAAGLPAGVINLIYVDGPEAGKIIFKHPDFAGLHFTGSTSVFKQIWKTIGDNINIYKAYPRIVGETGGKDFVLAHSSANPREVSTALLRGAFEYQGQKCSAASRAYIPADIWPEVKENLIKDLKSLKMGSPEDFSNFINAVIDERAFDKITKYIQDAAQDPDVAFVAGGNFDKSKGYFIEPVVLLVKDPEYITMCEEIFGPVLSVYVFEPDQFELMLKTIDKSPYALTGAIFCNEREQTILASKMLRHSAGNFYINDKPTGAVVGQQPFGGGRGSGTNDKAGSIYNLIRWVSPRTIKETFYPAQDYRYPFLQEKLKAES